MTTKRVTNAQMMAALQELPDPDLMTPTKLEDPLGNGAGYYARTMVRLLAAERDKAAKRLDAAVAAERERCAAIAESYEAAQDNMASVIARAIREA